MHKVLGSVGLAFLVAAGLLVPACTAVTERASVVDGAIPDGSTACSEALVACGDTCVDVSVDPANCGACGNVCAPGATCTPDASGRSVCREAPTCAPGTVRCEAECADLATSFGHCGACEVACAANEACVAGSCTPAARGEGSEGNFFPQQNRIVNTVRTGKASGTAGSPRLAVESVQGFAVGDRVIVHQTQGGRAGAYTFGEVARVDAVKNALVLTAPLDGEYTSQGASRAQVVRVHRWKSVTVPAGVTLTAPAWDGTSGGLLVFEATGTVLVDGTLDMSGRGYRGFSHAGRCLAMGGRYVCKNANSANGFSGESAAGPWVFGARRNGASGGGGEDGSECGAGGGGSHGTEGEKGSDGSGGGCRVGAQVGGGAGALAGHADLRQSLLFGGAGGEGGADEDGAYPGAGGNGGGIVFVVGKSVVVRGRIVSDGSDGGNGVQQATGCGGSNVGCGMGGGGGGAGGAVRIVADDVARLGDGRVSAKGGVGGECTCGGSPGGRAGHGRVGVFAKSASGTSSPAFDVR
jgi:hypothetical protein